MKTNIKTVTGAILLPLFALSACSQTPEEPVETALNDTEIAPDSAGVEAEKEAGVLEQAYEAIQETMAPPEGGIIPQRASTVLPENADLLMSFPEFRQYPHGVLKLTGDQGETCIMAHWVSRNVAGSVGASDIQCDTAPKAIADHEVLLDEAQLLNNLGMIRLTTEDATCIVSNFVTRDKIRPKGHIKLDCTFDFEKAPAPDEGP